MGHCAFWIGGVTESRDAAGAAALLPNFGRFSDAQAWTFWFGHLLPAGSTIANGGRLIKHGDPGDPQLDPATANPSDLMLDWTGKHVARAPKR